LPASGNCGVQLDTTVGPLSTNVLQVVVVQALPAEDVSGVQDATGTLLVLLVLQVVVTQLLLPEAAVPVQLCTGTLLVTTGAGQVVVV
jgi:hypothetical protein